MLHTKRGVDHRHVYAAADGRPSQEEAEGAVAVRPATSSGQLWTWGSTLYGSLGYPPTAAMPVDANNFPYQPKPMAVSIKSALPKG